MDTIRRTQPFERKQTEKLHTYKSMMPITKNHDLQLVSFSCAGDIKERALGAILETVTLEIDGRLVQEPLTGHTLMVRNALTGVQSVYDQGHNRTHIIVLAQPTAIENGDVLVMTLAIKQMTDAELKKEFGVKKNADLFDDPELFVQTGKANIHLIYQANPELHISPLCRFNKSIPFVTMNDDKHKQFVIQMKDYDVPPNGIFQIWFAYSIVNIQTVSSMYHTLNLNLGTPSATSDSPPSKETMHSYSSPVQLQVLDKLVWNLFSINPAAQTAQKKYQTITVGHMTADQLKECELQFVLHDQFFTDYKNWVNESKDKTKAIQDAMIVIQFGFLYHDS